MDITPLEELLEQRDTVASAELMQQLREGLSHAPAGSGEGRATHQLLLDFFKLDAHASKTSFASAFKRYPETAKALLTLCTRHQLTDLDTLLHSVMQGRAKPDGRFKKALHTQALANTDHPGLLAALQGFASAAFATPDHEAEIELSLAWSAMEDCLLDQVAEHATQLDFAWGPIQRKKREEAQAVRTALAAMPAAHWLQAFWTDISPYVMVQPSEWDLNHDNDHAAVIQIPVQHVALDNPLTDAQAMHLAACPSALQLLAVYREVPGAALFCTDPQDLWTAGFLLLPPTQWDEARSEMLGWLSNVDFQDDPEGPPTWVRSAIAFGKIPGDASYWMLPVEGPLAGHVLLSNEDASAETSRYPSFDSFIATLRLFPQQILGSGGYVSYTRADSPHQLYPIGYGHACVCQN
ncbi:MAG: hypothetical protein CFE44_04995 [Burkholderiales bacterium PBB4]|nr:MAG: hypothetical protein CFE44_04995 [Burkholderiales bacterium PBB4]